MDSRRSNGNKDYYEHERRRSRSRSRSRSPDHHRNRDQGRDYRDRGYDHRDRDRDRDREYRGREYESGGGVAERDRVRKDPTRTVILHGLAPRTTEPTVSKIKYSGFIKQTHAINLISFAQRTAICGAFCLLSKRNSANILTGFV